MNIPPPRTTFYFFLMTALFSILFCCIVFLSAGTDSETITDVAWFTGKSGPDYCFGNTGYVCYDIHISLFNLVVVSNLTSTSLMNWDDAGCNVEYCKHCSKVSYAITILVAGTLLLCIPGVYTNYKRASSDEDNNELMQYYGAMCLAICAVVAFAVGCRDKIESSTAGIGIDWTLGPSSSLMLGVAWFKLGELVANIFLPMYDDPWYCGCARKSTNSLEVDNVQYSDVPRTDYKDDSYSRERTRTTSANSIPNSSTSTITPRVGSGGSGSGMRRISSANDLKSKRVSPKVQSNIKRISKSPSKVPDTELFVHVEENVPSPPIDIQLHVVDTLSMKTSQMGSS